MDEPSNPELESFRQQWRAEVSAKSNPGDSSRAQKSAQPPSKPTARRPSVVPRAPPRPSADAESDNEPSDEDGELVSAPPHHASFEISSARTAVEKDVEKFSGTAPKEPESALEHYEKAAEREAQGNLGDSLTHYRKAFRIDDRVDLKYKNKHFPPSAAPKPTTSTHPSSTTPLPANSQPSSAALPTQDLLSSFSSLHITPAPPPIEGAPEPPCPIASLPQEILIHILTDLALLDPASFLRTAQTCKCLAYLIATEDQIWKRLCWGHEVGFGGMHYNWQLEVSGAPLPFALGTHNDIPVSLDLTPRPPLLLNQLYPSYATMFRHRPRLRFDGLYISTVNYMRAGAAAATQSTWDSPVHIVTYYRYLRFFRSGAVISLLGTHEPSEVVHALLPSLLEGKRAPKGSAVADARRGRWRLGGGAGGDGEEKDEAPGDEAALTIETEGCDTRYIYRMALRVKGQERGRARLGWEGFWNWNRLTDDWGEFGLRNDKPFVFSKVHSYGLGV